MSEWTSVEDKDNYPGFGWACEIKGEREGFYVEGVATAYICPEYSNLMWHDENDDPVPWNVTHWKPHKQETN